MGAVGFAGASDGESEPIGFVYLPENAQSEHWRGVDKCLFGLWFRCRPELLDRWIGMKAGERRERLSAERCWSGDAASEGPSHGSPWRQ